MPTIATSVTTDAHEGVPDRERRLAFLSLSAGVAIGVFDAAALFVALPPLTAYFGITPSQAVWIVLSYQIAMVASLLPFAVLGDTIGHRRLQLAGLAVVAAASAFAALSDDLVVLCVARAFQGLGASASMAIHGAVLRDIYPARTLGQGIGGTTFVVAVTGAATPSLAALLLSVSDWHWLFWVNLPIAGIGYLTGAASMPRTKAKPHALDGFSVVLNVAAFGLLIAGIGSIGHSPAVLVAAEIVLAVVAGAALTWRQLPLPSPMLPVDLLRIFPFACSVGAAVLAFAAQTMAFVALPFFLLHGLGKGVGETGLLLTAWPLATAIVSLNAARLTSRFAPSRICAIGMAVYAAAAIVFASTPGSAILLVVILAVCGFGFGLFQAPNNQVMLSSAPRARSSGASGAQATSRLCGQSLGAAIVAGIYAVAGPSAAQVVMLVSAALAVGAAVVAYLPVRRSRR